MDTCSAVKQRLAELCYQKHWSIYKLSTESGISPSTVKSILYGKSQNPGIVTIKMLCDGLGISLSDFFGAKIFSALEQEIE